MLVTLDASLLCINIPYSKGIAGLARMMDEVETDTQLSFFISCSGHQVLTRKYFKFNNQLYRQKQGTAMGTRMAPDYVIIFMHYLKIKLLTKVKSMN